MKHQVIFRSNWAMTTALLIIFAIVGCQPSALTRPPETSSIPEPSSTPETALPSPEPSMPMPTSQPGTDTMPMPTAQPGTDIMPMPTSQSVPVLYQDDFTKSSTGWPARTFDNYFIGYHEPQYYFIQITSPNYKITPIIEPNKKSYSDATIELQVLTDSANTATEGDFRYGLVFRRAGDNYYAFAISPRTKKWYVFKSSPKGPKPLKEGVEESIKGLNNVDDLLRVDSQGSNFFFHINDRLVWHTTDSDYAEGQIGLYAESIDSSQTRIHFDTFTIRVLEIDYICSINGTMYVRSGPGKSYSPIALLSNGDTVKALGISSNRWIKIIVEGVDAPGWVSYRYMSCTPSVDLFPVIVSP